MAEQPICAEDCEVPFRELLPVVAPHIVGIEMDRSNDEIIKMVEREANRAVRLVAREVGGFCRSANLDTQSNVCYYWLEPPDCWRINLISQVSYHGCCLGAWRDDCSMPCPGFYRYDKKDDRIYIGDPIECDERGAIRVTARMLPSHQSCGMPQRVWNDYCEAIEFKLLELLYNQGSQQWHSAVKSAQMKREFKEVINDIRWIEHEREHMEGVLLRRTDKAWISSR